MDDKRPDVATAFAGALSQTSPSRDTPLPVGRPDVGRRRMRDVFNLKADRIRVDDEQVRREGKGPDNAETIELAESIREQGLMQFPQVRYLEDADVYQLVSGERRFTACTQILGWDEMPVKLIEVSESELIWIQLHENLHRRDLSPLELAAAIGKAKASGLSLQQIADKLKKSKTFVQKALTIANKLTGAARQELERGEQGRGMEVTYAVSTLPAKEQADMARQIVSRNLSKQNVVELMSQRKAGLRRAAGTPATVTRARSTRAAPFEKRFVVSPGTTVTVTVVGKQRVGDEELRRALQVALAALSNRAGRTN